MRATKKHLAGIVAATTVGAYALYRFRGPSTADDSPDIDAEASA